MVFDAQGRVSVVSKDVVRRKRQEICLMDAGGADGRVVATDIGLRLSGNLTFDSWQDAGSRISKLSDLSSWCLGDWLAYGESQYVGRYRAAVELVGLNYQTLRNYAWVARRFSMSRRRDELSFGHHMEVARLTTAEQDRWLDQAIEGRWTTSQLRRRLKESRMGTDLQTAAAAPMVPRLRVEQERVDRWRVAAERSSMDFASWMMASLDRAAADALELPAEAS